MEPAQYCDLNRNLPFEVTVTFKYRGDIAHADIAFDAFGKTLEELFSAAAEATIRVMIDDPSALRRVETIDFSLDQTDQEMLLFDFLNEIIFYKDARRLLLLPERLEIARKDGEGYTLQARLSGEGIDPQRHRLSTDVKAVTMLRFSVRQVAQGWQATVVLDV